MKLSALLAVVGWSLILVAPAVVAVHGEAYDATGIALLCTAPVPEVALPPAVNVLAGGCGDASNEVFVVDLAWSGYWTQEYTITIRDAASAIVAQETFPGCWTANGPYFYLGEVLAYRGWARDGSFCNGGASSAHFDISGWQGQQVAQGAPNRALMLYAGHYEQYTLVLVVPYGLI